MERNQAAYTKPDPTYPAFINMTREGDTVTVTVRADAREGKMGPLASITLDIHVWRVLLGEVHYSSLNR